MSSNNTIQSLWIGGRLSTMERLSIASFRANGHPYRLYVYDEVEGVPEGVEVLDASAILPRTEVFANTKEGMGHGSFASFSDWFRYEMLARDGGWWADTDVVCLRPLDFDSEAVIATSREGKWGTPAINCMMRFAPGDPLLNFCRDFCRNEDIKSLVDKQYAAIGPHLVQRGIRELGLHDYTVGPDAFCPINWRHVKFLWSRPLDRHIYNFKRTLKGGEKVHHVTDETYGVHLWSGGWEAWRRGQGRHVSRQ